eukprot:CAMPEP_0114984138 /NCGR_PEP_ID=MMETSP0216-20121206/7102_1 /TAXON_ID=223996 /ORGANISM="Protocruzia adherens, Strain Boccale" /LENGTH=675 /DNA_ID=CAMNT_0002346225 /DNA_START=497 /DNA_END=2521 /DNA_ORIENTATION=-
MQSQETIYVFYASQTGNSESISKFVTTELQDRGVNVEHHVLNDHTKKFSFENKPGSEFRRPRICIFVLSSTGDGDCPDNGNRFMRWVCRRTQPEDLMKGVKFTVLGLGDTNYNQYQKVPRKLRDRLLQLGAKTFYKCGEADEAVGMEGVVDPWIANLIPALGEVLKIVSRGSSRANSEDFMGADSSAISPVKKSSDAGQVGQIKTECDVGSTALKEENSEIIEPAVKEFCDPRRPFYAEIATCRYLTGRQAQKRVLHMELNIQRPDGTPAFEYLPGGSIGILPKNSEEEVQKVMNLFGWTDKVLLLEEQLPTGLLNITDISLPCSLKSVLIRGIDIWTTFSQSSLIELSTYLQDSEEVDKLRTLAKSSEKYATFVRNTRGVIDTFNAFKSWKAPLPVNVIKSLPKMYPRYYSISSSPIATPDSVAIAFTIVDTPQLHGRKNVRGVATNWLEDMVLSHSKTKIDKLANTLNVAIELDKTLTIPVFCNTHSHELSLTEKWLAEDTPLMMVGAGTGIVPFLGILEHMNLAKNETKYGPVTVFAGCRHEKQQDFYDLVYGKECKNAISKLQQGEYLVACSEEDDADEEDECSIGMWRSVRVNCHYVQDKIFDSADRIYDQLFNREGVLMVCGDGKRMASDIYNTIVKIVLRKNPSMPRQEAIKKVDDLKKARRYLQEIW